MADLIPMHGVACAACGLPASSHDPELGITYHASRLHVRAKRPCLVRLPTPKERTRG